MQEVRVALNVQLAPTIKRKLAQIAWQEGTSVSVVVREVVEKYIRWYEACQEKNQRKEVDTKDKL